MTAGDARPPAALTAWISRWVAEELGLAAAEVEPDRPFLSYGLNSIQAMMLVGDLETHLGRPLPPTLVWDHPTVAALAAHLADQPSADIPGTPAAIPADAAALLAQLDDLPDDQVDALLRQYMK